MIRRLLQDNKVPGTSVGTRAIAALGPVPAGSAAGFLGESQVNGSLPCQTRFEQHRNGPGCLQSLEGIRTKWQTHRGSVHLLRLWTPAGKSWAMAGPETDSPQSGWRVGLHERPDTCLERQV